MVVRPSLLMKIATLISNLAAKPSLAIACSKGPDQLLVVQGFFIGNYSLA